MDAEETDTTEETTEAETTTDAETEEESSETEAEAEVEETETEDADDGKLPEKLQRKLDAKIGKATAKQRAAEERAAAAEERATEAEKRVDKEQLEAAMALGVHPDYVNAEELTTLKRYDEISALVEHIDENWDDDDALVKLDKSDSPSAERVRRNYNRMLVELGEIKADAKRIKREKTALMLEDMRRGQKEREAKKKRTPPAGEQPTTKKDVPRPPRVPARVAGSPGGIRTGQPGQGFDAKRLAKEGVTREKLQGAYESFT